MQRKNKIFYIKAKHKQPKNSKKAKHEYSKRKKKKPIKSSYKQNK